MKRSQLSKDKERAIERVKGGFNPFLHSIKKRRNQQIDIGGPSDGQDEMTDKDFEKMVQ